MQNQNFYKKYGPWAIVTGASDGIGKEIARELALKGFNLILVARRKDLLHELSQEFKVQTKILSLDLSNQKSVEELIDQAKDIDVGLLVHAAGFGSAGLLMNSKLNDELSMLDVNCKAALVLSRHFGKKFSNKKNGGIILFSSLVAFQGVPYSANYAATKAYIQSLAEALHEELAPYHVDVLASAPGPVLSGFGNRAQMHMTVGLTPDIVAKSTLNALGKKTTVRPGWLSKLLEWALKPLPRWGRVKMMQKIMKDMAQL